MVRALALSGPELTMKYASQIIHKNTAQLVGVQLLHLRARLLYQLRQTPQNAALEFEYRYRKALLEFGEADSDIYISTYSKSGTTWMQMILYHLTTAGDMSFDHLFDVSPWVWYAALRQVPLASCPAPRLLKSHDDYARFRGGRRGRVVFVVRDGKDVCVSLYHHRRNFKGFEGSFDEHFEDFLYGTEYNWFTHVKAWLRNDADLPMQVVKYEDLRADFINTVSTLADFLEIDVEPTKLQHVKEACSFHAMKRHELQLGPRDEHFLGMVNSPYHVKNPDQFIRRGVSGEGLERLSSRQLADYQQRFDQELKQFSELKDYR